MDELLYGIKDEDASSGLAVEGAACSGWNLLVASPVASSTWEDITEMDADTLKQRGVTGILDETIELVDIDSDDEVELPFMHHKERATTSTTRAASITGCTRTSTHSTAEPAESLSPYRTSCSHSIISGPQPEEEGEVGGVTVSSDSGVTGVSVDGVSGDDLSASGSVSMAREPSAKVLLDSLRDTSQHQFPDSAPQCGVISISGLGTSSPIMPGVSELIAAREERATAGSGCGLGKEEVGPSNALDNCEPIGKLGQDEEKLVAQAEMVPSLGLEAIQAELIAGDKQADSAKDLGKDEMDKSQVPSAGSDNDIIDLKTCLLTDFENDRQTEESAGDIGGSLDGLDVYNERTEVDMSPLDNIVAGSVDADSGCCDDECIRSETKGGNQTFTLDLLAGEAVVEGEKGVALSKVFLDNKEEETADVTGTEVVGGAGKEVDELEKEMNMADQEVGMSSKKVGVAIKEVGAISCDDVSLNPAKDIKSSRAENSNESQQPGVAEGTEVKSAVVSKQVSGRQLVMPGAFKGVVKSRQQKTALPPAPVIGNVKSDVSRMNKGLKVPSSKLPISSKLPVASKQCAASKLPVATSKLPTTNVTTTVKLQAKLNTKKLNTLVMPSKSIGLPKVAVASQSTSSRLIRPASRRGPLKAVQNNNLVKPSQRNTTMLIKPATDSTKATNSQDSVNGLNAQTRSQVVTKGIPTAAAKTSADDPPKSANTVDLAFSPTPLKEGVAITSTPCCRPPSDGALGQTQVISRSSLGPLRKNEAAPLPVVSPRDETDQKNELSRTVTKPRSSLGSTTSAVKTTPTSGGKRRSLIPTPQGRQFSPSDQHVTPLRANLQQAKKRLSIDTNNDMSPQLTSEPCNTTRSIAYPQRKLVKSKVGTVRVGMSKKPFKPRNGGRGIVRPAPPQKVVQPTAVYEEDIFGQENDVPPPAKNCLMHSPLNKDDLPKTPHSKWSPIKRTQPGIDSCYRCTKVSRIKQ